MSSFNGQMKEYTQIAIDRFDGKNLQCTAFFLSHCHKDHLVGLNSSSFVDCLLERDGVFLYCSEITRVLLLAEKEYSQLIEYIRVLKVGVLQTVRVPTNGIALGDYYVNVTPISAGHCPGSVMFLFEGHEGRCLYTGDFRWEISHAAGIASFREENRVKEIQSLYVDTTFCIPEAYHIPKRNECVEAAMTVVSDWLKRSSLNIVLISCPARYGHEHLLMKLSKRLNVKIHVPEWKVQIYDQIPDLQNVFTSDPNQARIHACSFKVGYLSCLPYKQQSLLKLRPSTMWFTSDKSKSTTQDLIVTPVSQRGLYRICYSMHSSYSEIRDLVSYLQPNYVYPNVIPVSDAGIDAVQTRLNNFQKHLNKARVLPSVVETQFQPLGALRKVVIDQASTQPSYKQDAESSDELMFSSQEASQNRELLKSVNKSHIRAHGKSAESNNFKTTTDESPSPENVLSNLTSQSDSSYKCSVISDEELNLFSDNGDDDDKTVCIRMLQTIEDNSDKKNGKNSKCTCITSGNEISVHVSSEDTDVSLHASSEDTDLNLKGAYDAVPFTSYYAQGSFATVLDVNKTSVDISQSKLSKCTKSRETDSVSRNYVTRCTQECTASINTIRSNSENGDCLHNICQDIEHSDDNDDIVLNSQVFPFETLYKNHLIKASRPNESTTCIYSSNILASDNKYVAGVTNTNDSPLTDYIHESSKETVTILSASDDSQNTPEQESQALWSVSYNLDNFTPSDSFGKKTVNDCLNITSKSELNFNKEKENLGCMSTVETEGTDKEDFSLKQLGANTLRTTKQFLLVQSSSQRKAIKVKSLKRKISKSVESVNASNFKQLRNGKAENKNDAFNDITSDIKGECMTCCDKVAQVSKSSNCSLKKGSHSKCKTICSEINSVKDCYKCSANNSYTKGNDSDLSVSSSFPCSTHNHKVKSCSCKHTDGDFHEVLTQSVNKHAPHKPEWIDLTVEIPDDVVDLTLESSQ